MEDAARHFERTLGRQRTAHRIGRCVRELVRVAGYAVLALTAFAVADFLLAFSAPALVRIGHALLIALILIALIRLAFGLRFSLRDYAAHVDHVQRNRRQDVYGALELAPARADDGARDPLQRYLIGESVKRAKDRLDALSLRDVWPSPLLTRQIKIFAAQLAVALLCLAVPHAVSAIVLERIFFPERDRPPYSPYTFHIDPESPRVLYGQSVEIGVEIAGAPVRDAVWLLTRRDGRIQRAACFQDSPERYAQRLEHVVQPIEFAFAVGRARSEWHTIDLLLDPRIVTARATLTPPAYSGKPVRTIVAGEAPIAELVGARVALEVASNRPLLDGTLTLRAEDGSGDEQVIAGSAAGTHRMRFEWTLRTPAELAVQVRDVRGTPNQEPLVLRQAVVPDEPPRVVMTEPAAFALATPDATVTLAGYAEDDLALRRVELVRGLVGYRDRIEPLGPDIPRARWPFERALDLSQLGVVPGQVLEFFLEAQDNNPAWTGIGASDVVRIEIISDEDYAEMVRSRVRAEEFIARYQAAMQAVQDIKSRLEELLEQMQDENADLTELAKQYEDFKKAYDEAQAMIDQLARDFPAFDSETALRSTLRDLSAMLKRHRPALDGRELDDEQLQRRLEMMLSQLRDFDAPMREHMETAEHITQIARVFDMTQRYLQLVRAQEQLVRRMERYPDPSRIRDPALFDSFRREESAIREALVEFREELVRRAEALSDEYDELKQSSLEFAEAIERLEIPDVMQNVIQSAQNRIGADMVQQSELALERMRELINECQSNPFGGLMECELRFTVRETARQTLNQMMQSWAGVGAGMGQGGGAGDGYSTSAHTPLNVPMFGPGRSDIMQRMLEGGLGREQGGAGTFIDARGRQLLQMDHERVGEREASPLERAPDKYRDALRRYFGITEDAP